MTILMRCYALLAGCLLAGACAAQTDRARPPLPPIPARPPELIAAPAGAGPIVLRQLSVRAEISGSMAETTVRMVFFNPNRRVLEGQLQFPLAGSQQVTGFALDIDGAMRPAVPVEKTKGRAVFEAIERRGVDPALLETTQGNNFRLRVYPIAAQSTRTVEVRYSEPLMRRGDAWLYTLPGGFGKAEQGDMEILVNAAQDGAVGQKPRLSGAMEALRFEADVRGYRAHFSALDLGQRGASVVLVPATRGPQVYRQERNGTSYFVAEIPLPAQPVIRPAPRRVGLLWDGSGSGAARALGAELAVLDAYFKALGKVEVRLVRLRDRPDAALNFTVRDGDWSALRAALESTAYDGASALNDWTPQASVDQYLLFSDGLGNYGPATPPQLAPGQRLFALNSAAAADTGRLAGLAEASGGELIEIDAQAPDEAARALLNAGPRVTRLAASGAADLQADTRAMQNGLLRVAGRLTGGPASLQLTLASAGHEEALELALPADAPLHPLAAYLWASLRLRALESAPELHRAEIGRVGKDFGIATRETSLIVLDRLDDYLRYDIAPPAAYTEAYEQMKRNRNGTLQVQREQHLDAVLRMFQSRQAWWATPFPKTVELKPYATSGAPMHPLGQAPGVDLARAPLPAPAPPPAAPLQAYAERRAAASENEAANKSTSGQRLRYAAPAPAMSPPIASTGANAPSAQSTPEIGVALAKWVDNAPYIARLRDASAATIYTVYLDERPDHANSSAFFLDAADALFAKGQRELGLRVLSNLAEMDLDNRAVLRILGYRLLQAGAPQLAIPVFEKVRLLAPEEPQSFRDLGLAYEQAGQRQAAVDALYEVVARPWDQRFPEIENIALAELNAIVARAAKPLDLSRIDPRLLKNLPLDLRVVMSWDADNSDMDLWVTDPSGEKSYYGNPLSRQGGRMSRDFTQGYGPEEFALRAARPGKYRIEANYYGNRQQILAGATTLQVKLFTGFGTARQKESTTTLRLKERTETVFVGEFEVKP